jgi:protein-tyrosine phosphatase
LIDLHSHVLHDTDDGALSLDQAVAMVKMAASDGCVALVATPHQRRDEWNTSDPVRLAERLAEIVARAKGAPDLHLGAEIRVDSDLLADLDRRERSGVLPLAGSRWLLLELDPEGVGPDPVDLVEELGARGWRPILAHPEMIPFLWDDEIDWFPRLVESGASLQVTAMSVTGEFGRGPRERAWQLLDAGWVQFVASDAHRPDWRPPGLSRAFAQLEARLGEAAARALTVEHPRAVIEDRPLVASRVAGSPSPAVSR